MTPEPNLSLSSEDLDILGMTCAACVRRVDKALRAVPGVQDAHVNLVTNRATVRFDAALTTQSALEAAVAKAGYEIAKPEPAAETKSRADILAEAEAREQRAIRRDFVIALALSLPP